MCLEPFRTHPCAYLLPRLPVVVGLRKHPKVGLKPIRNVVLPEGITEAGQPEAEASPFKEGWLTGWSRTGRRLRGQGLLRSARKRRSGRRGECVSPARDEAQRDRGRGPNFRGNPKFRHFPTASAERFRQNASRLQNETRRASSACARIPLFSPDFRASCGLRKPRRAHFSGFVTTSGVPGAENA